MGIGWILAAEIRGRVSKVKRLLEGGENAMKRFKNILYATETCMVTNAFQRAIALAENNCAQLTVLLVMEPAPASLELLTPYNSKPEHLGETEAALNNLRESYAKRINIETRIVEGDPLFEIIREVTRSQQDLVIKTAEGKGTALDRIFGTTDIHLLCKCPCTVWLDKPTNIAPIRRIMAPVAFDTLDPKEEGASEPMNRMILETAVSLAHQEGSECHVLHACQAVGDDLMKGKRSQLSKEEIKSYIDVMRFEQRNCLDRLLERARTWIGTEIFDVVCPKTELRNGAALSVIPILVKELDIELIIMGTVWQTGFSDPFTSNTAESFLNNIDCSVLAVKPTGSTNPDILKN